jgi:CBS domain-containing protein
LRRLSEEQVVPRELALEAAEAFEFILHLRLTHQLGLAEQGLPPDNYIDPGALSALERRTLKEAFGLIGRIQAFLRERFRLNV